MCTDIAGIGWPRDAEVGGLLNGQNLGGHFYYRYRYSSNLFS